MSGWGGKGETGDHKRRTVEERYQIKLQKGEKTPISQVTGYKDKCAGLKRLDEDIFMSAEEQQTIEAKPMGK